MEKDYYAILGVPKNATAKDLQWAYRRLAQNYHNDRSPGAQARFKDILEAYEVLSDKHGRQIYDLQQGIEVIAGAAVSLLEWFTKASPTNEQQNEPNAGHSAGRRPRGQSGGGSGGTRNNSNSNSNRGSRS